MKKTLIALSVLAAMSGAAQAQSNVTIYGVADMALQAESRGAGKFSRFSRPSIGKSSSIWGIRYWKKQGLGLRGDQC